MHYTSISDLMINVKKLLFKLYYPEEQSSGFFMQTYKI